MRKAIFMALAIFIGALAVSAVLTGCSQGYSNGRNGAAVTQTPQAQATQSQTILTTQTTQTQATQAQPIQAPQSTPQTSITAPTGTGGQTSKSSTAYRPTGFTPTVSGSSILLPMDTVAQASNGNFFVNNMPFMAYLLDGKYYVRANLCVPCGSRTFTLQNGNLVCGACGTVFNATTGTGIRGVSACMTYAKKAAVVTSDGTNLVMTLQDLTTAYQNTLYRKN